MKKRQCHGDDDDDQDRGITTKTRSAYVAGHNKKKLHPLLLGPGRRDQNKYVPLQVASKNNLSEFTQRIMSAKLLRVKQVQNQLSETQIQLNELINENRILRNLQKRQEGALRKYEGNHAELPQLIRSHNEEIRTLKASNKLIKAQLKESNGKLKERDNELESLKESYNKLKKLSSEKNLLEREKLQKKVEELQNVIKEQEEKIQVLSRKILLESKNYRHHLNIETSKHKETQKELGNAMSTIARLENQLLSRDKTTWVPGTNVLGKIAHKRESKILMPTISAKSFDVQNGHFEAEFSKGESIGKAMNGSSENDFEILNGLISSGDASGSPTRELFPELNPSKRSDSDVELTVKTNLSKSKSSLIASRKNGKVFADAETNAKGIVEKITRNIESMDDMVKRNDLKVSNSSARLTSLYREVKTKMSKLEEEITAKTSGDRETSEEETKESVRSVTDGSIRRNVSKRKLVEEKAKRNCDGVQSEREYPLDLSETEKEKLKHMTKTWNHIRDKAQEERMKAEQKMKELSLMDKSDAYEFEGDGEGDEKEKEEEDEEDDDDGGNARNPNANDPGRVLYNPNDQKRDKSADFCDGTDKEFTASNDCFRRRSDSVNCSVRENRNFPGDDYILNQLEKADKMFKKLKDEKINCNQILKNSTLKPRHTTSEGISSSSSSPPAPTQTVQNATFRTESRRAPKYLEEFQNEHQKQNLLKALRTIDVGKTSHSISSFSGIHTNKRHSGSLDEEDEEDGNDNGNNNNGSDDEDPGSDGEETEELNCEGQSVAESANRRLIFRQFESGQESCSGSDLISELFKSNRKKSKEASEGSGFEYGIVDGIKTRND